MGNCSDKNGNFFKFFRQLCESVCKDSLCCIGFEVLSAAITKSFIFWDIMAVGQ
jgi:hypothetical protein